MRHPEILGAENRGYDKGTLYRDVTAGRFQLSSLFWVGLKMTGIFRYLFHSTFMPAASSFDGLTTVARGGND